MKPKCDEPLSNFAFKFNFRRYGKAASEELNVDAYVGCYITKPSAPPLSHRIGARAPASAADTVIPLKRCAKMCEHCRDKLILPAASSNAF